MAAKPNSAVICRLPAAGLGNQLFPLLRGHTFAALNHLPVYVQKKNKLGIGPYLRFERRKRNYENYFTFTKGIIGTWVQRLALREFQLHAVTVNEPDLHELEVNPQKTAFVYFEAARYTNYFKGLKEHRPLVKKILMQLVDESVHSEVASKVPPEIGVHIRMGDFRKLNQGEVFNGGHVRTPEDYFVNIIAKIRIIAGKNIPVTVFTDGYRNELKKIEALQQITFSDCRKDISEILLLSKSKLIITSAGSTFGAWSAFLSDAIVIKHQTQLHEAYRNEAGFYEGIFDENNPELIKKIISSFT